MNTATHERWEIRRVLAPVEPTAFLRDSWQRSCVHVARQNPHYYDGLLSRSDLACHLDDPAFFTAVEVEAPNAARPAESEPPTSGEEVRRRLDGGTPLRIRHLERWLPADSSAVTAARSIGHHLGLDLRSLSCYFAPTNSIGLGPHHDECEIFTLQIEGRKQWKFFGLGDARTPARYVPSSLPDPVRELVLEPGDLLYTPPGLIHDVKALRDSLSLTLVFAPASPTGAPYDAATAE